MQSLTLGPGVLDEIIENAKSSYPLESCGLLVGQGGYAARLLPMENCLASRTAYEMDAGQLIGALRALRESGEQLAAIYHSHPSSPAEPSKRDIERAFYPDSAYLIVSLAESSQPEVRAFSIAGGQAFEIELRVIV